MNFSRNKRYDPETLWKLPAAVSMFALLVIPLTPLLSRFGLNSLLRDGLVLLLALGVCAAMLGLGFGLWIGVRIKRPSAVLAGVFSVVVALLWYRKVIAPMIQGELP